LAAGHSRASAFFTRLVFRHYLLRNKLAIQSRRHLCRLLDCLHVNFNVDPKIAQDPQLRIAQLFNVRALERQLRAARDVEEVERDYILAVVRAGDGNKIQAAQKLKIGTATLYGKLKQYDAR
jgi:DNA-binding NtrC family response regulator